MKTDSVEPRRSVQVGDGLVSETHETVGGEAGAHRRDGGESLASDLDATDGDRVLVDGAAGGGTVSVYSKA